MRADRSIRDRPFAWLRTSAVAGFATVVFGAAPAAAVLLLHDEFDDPTGPLIDRPDWSDFNSTADSSILVSNGSLGAVLPDASPYPAIGNRVVAGAGTEDLRSLDFGAQVDTVTWFSLLLRVDSTPGLGADPSYVFGLRAGSNQAARFFLVPESSPAEFRMGVNGSLSGAAPADVTDPLDVGTVYRIVGKFDATTDPDTISLWVDPPGFTEATAGAPDAHATNDVALDDPSHFYLRQGGDWDAGLSGWTIDSLRVGTTFEDVALSPIPAPASTRPHRVLLVLGIVAAAGFVALRSPARADD